MPKREMLQMEEIYYVFELHIWTDLTFFSDEDIVIAQYDFQPASDHDLQFKKGDRLKVIKEWVLFFCNMSIKLK